MNAMSPSIEGLKILSDIAPYLVKQMNDFEGLDMIPDFKSVIEGVPSILCKR